MPISDQRASEVRQELQGVLNLYPSTLRQVLRIDPARLTDSVYLGPYPALTAFLDQHPEVAHNPAYFLGSGGVCGRRCSRRYRGVHGVHFDRRCPDVADPNSDRLPSMEPSVSSPDRGAHQDTRQVHVQRGSAGLCANPGRESVSRIGSHPARRGTSYGRGTDEPDSVVGSGRPGSRARRRRSSLLHSTTPGRPGCRSFVCVGNPGNRPGDRFHPFGSGVARLIVETRFVVSPMADRTSTRRRGFRTTGMIG